MQDLRADIEIISRPQEVRIYPNVHNMGQFFLIQGDLCLSAQVDVDVFKFISVGDGNRWSDSGAATVTPMDVKIRARPLYCRSLEGDL